MEHKDIPTFPEFYRMVKGGTPSGQLWEAYHTNLLVDASMLRLVAMPPDSPPAAIARCARRSRNSTTIRTTPPTP